MLVALVLHLLVVAHATPAGVPVTTGEESGC